MIPFRANNVFAVNNGFLALIFSSRAILPVRMVLLLTVRIAKKENVGLASVNGIGATDDFTVGVFDLQKSEYEKIKYIGNHEINVLTGNVTEKDGAPYIHLHITCTGKDGKVVGGHLISGIISLTAEIFIDTIDGKIDRKFDEQLRINRITF